MVGVGLWWILRMWYLLGRWLGEFPSFCGPQCKTWISLQGASYFLSLRAHNARDDDFHWYYSGGLTT
jgi:hypothetical protein